LAEFANFPEPHLVRGKLRLDFPIFFLLTCEIDPIFDEVPENKILFSASLIVIELLSQFWNRMWIFLCGEL